MKQVRLFITKKGYQKDKKGGQTETTLYARPCAECFKLMQYYGVKKVYYTTKKEGIVSVNTNNVDTKEEFVSDAQKLFIEDRHWIT